jgi:AcrR family transcriptional regulator
VSAPLGADAAHTRERLLAVAREAVDAGDLTLALDEVANRAGVGMGTVRRHFPHRHALLEALVERSFAELVEVARAAAAAPDPFRGLTDLLEAALRIGVEDPAFGEVLAAPGDAGSALGEARQELLRAAADVLRRARQAGVVRRDLRPDDLLRLLCGIGYAARIHSGPTHPGTVDERARAYLRIVVAGLRTDR